MKRRIPCKVLPGLFDNEQLAFIKSFEGKELSLFVPKEDVDFSGIPSRENPAMGYLTVLVLDQKGGLALVRLPGERHEFGSFITVRQDDLKSATNCPLA